MSAASENRELRMLAGDVDNAIAALEATTLSYLAEAERQDVAYRIKNNGAEHPSLGRRHTLVRSAVASRAALYRVLDLVPKNPPITLAGTVAPDQLAPSPKL